MSTFSHLQLKTVERIWSSHIIRLYVHCRLTNTTAILGRMHKSQQQLCLIRAITECASQKRAFIIYLTYLRLKKWVHTRSNFIIWGVRGVNMKRKMAVSSQHTINIYRIPIHTHSCMKESHTYLYSCTKETKIKGKQQTWLFKKPTRTPNTRNYKLIGLKQVH